MAATVARSAAITITDTTITVDPAAISAQAHNYLDNIAILGEADPGRFVYRLYAPAAHQAFESGQTLDQILEAWGKLFDIPIPDAIQSQLTAWWQAYGQVRLYENVTVIEFGDDYALAEMKAASAKANDIELALLVAIFELHKNSLQPDHVGGIIQDHLKQIIPFYQSKLPPAE